MDVREKAKNDKRLIDANAFLKDILTAGVGKTIIEYSESDIGYMIRKRPTVDAVEVVRCRDCKWYMPGDLFTDIMFCHRLKKGNGKPAKYNYCADDFCSYGERKEGAD